MTAKDNLRRYRNAKIEAQQIAEQIRNVKLLATAPRISRISDEPRGGGSGDPILNAVIKIDELEQAYLSKIAGLVELQLSIEKAIEPLEPTERILIREYYFAGNTWEQVADLMGYSWRHVHRIHSAALQKINIQPNVKPRFYASMT